MHTEPAAGGDYDPVRDRAEEGSEIFRRVLYAAAVLIPLVVYLLTLSRSVTFDDSGELAAVAATLGIAHPPGYPLFTLAGHLFSWLPAGTMVFRIALLSALAGALSSGLIVLAASQVLRSSRPGPPGTALLLACLAGGLLFAFAATPWSQAVITEVYALQALLVTAFFAGCAWAWRDPTRAVRAWPVVALAFGLGLANHLTMLLFLPALLLFLIISIIDRARSRSPEPIPVARTLAAGLSPLLLYLYLPIRSRMDPAINWDYPETLHRLFMHVTARQYQGQFLAQGIRWHELRRFAEKQLPAEAGWILVVLAVIGLAALMVRSRRFGFVGIAAIVPMVLYNLAYPIHDIAVYYISAIAVLATWAAIGAGYLVRGAAFLGSRGRSRGAASRDRREGSRGAAFLGSRGSAPALIVAAALVLSALLPLRANWRQNDMNDFRMVERFFKDCLDGVETDAVIFSDRWDIFSAPALYFQHVEQYRPDVVILDLGRLSGAGLARRLDRAAPDLVPGCRREMADVAEILNLTERRKPFDMEAARARYQGLLRRLALESVRERPTLVVSEMHRHPMFDGLERHPEGLLTRLDIEQRYQPYPAPALRGPGITRSQARTERERDLVDEYARRLRHRVYYQRVWAVEPDPDLEARAAAFTK